MKKTQKEERRLFSENRALLLRLLQENNTVEFGKLLNERPNYIHMRCCDEYGVSS